VIANGDGELELIAPQERNALRLPDSR